MPPVIRRLTLVVIVALSASPLVAHAHAHGDGTGAAPSVPMATGMVPFRQAVVPRSAVVVAPRQNVVVNPARARNVTVAPQQRVIVVPEQHAMMRREHDKMAHGHRIFVVPEAVLVVPQTPVYYVIAPYQSCVWCDELGCVR